MNLRTLQIFAMVCEEGNITKAATRLYMTQPAVSHVIKDLEEELQLSLFERRGKRIFLNETGKVFLSKAQRVLLSFDDLTKIIPTLVEQSSIRIGSSITIANDHLPIVLKKFHQLYPHIEVSVYVESAYNIMHRLTEHDVDLALVEGMIVNEKYKKVYFSSYHLQAVCSKTHPFAKKKRLSWEDVKEAKWLLREKGSAARDTFDSACRLHQLMIEPIWTSVNSQALLQAVRHNLGITLLPDSIIDVCPFKDELKVVSIEKAPLCNDNHIVYDESLFISEPLEKLMQLLKRSVKG